MIPTFYICGIPILGYPDSLGGWAIEFHKTAGFTGYGKQRRPKRLTPAQRYYRKGRGA